MDRDQRKRLKRANEIRTHNAKLKTDLRSLPSHEALFVAADVIETRGNYEKIRLFDLLKACPQVGDAVAWQLMTGKFKVTTKLEELHPIDRQLIAHAVRGLAKKRQLRFERAAA